MSSQAPAASADPPALSKSAKKKAKKAAKAAKQQSFDSAALAAVDDELHSSAQFAEGRPALNPAADFSAAALEPYYEDAVAKLGIDPAAAAVANAAASAARTRGLPPDPLTFASYAFDHPLGPPPGDNPFDTGFSPSVGIGHDELLETANELFRRMHYDSYGDDDPYWSTLPTHVRQFIREAIPFNGQSNPSNDPHATQKDLYAMAQRIVQAASHGIGFQAVNPMNGRAHMPSSIAEDLGFHNHPNHPDAPAREDEYDEEDDFDEEPESGLVQPNGEAPKKKNKKKKKKATQPVEPPPATLPPPAVKQPPRQPVPPQPQPLLPQPQLHPPPPPVASAPSAQPAPSSRAAGKQPMTHAPVAAANPPARSVRAAGKAPVTATPHTHHNHTHPPPPKLGNKGKAAAPAQPAKIWTAASPEEREAITQFWLALSDAERRDLLQLEKESVLKRMKEQQRHSCGCAVCGRKKVNIEMELEQLYHGYYADLEQYTSHQRAAMASQDCPPPPGAGPFPGSVEIDPSGQLLKLDHLAPNSSHHPSVDESDEDYEDDDYEDEEEIDEDDLASEEADTDYARKPKAHASRPEGSDDFFGFGKNLATIKGIITVADDMLKNDGAKFLEMMEQLAVKRVAREELNARELQEETDEDDEEDDISESQRMEDGRRMFAIFAARMFETRVLTAYRERVAKEREEQLLRELEAEEEGQRAKQEKKAKEAQRKRDKKKAQKQRQDDERAAREAAAAEEARAAEAKAAEDAKERQRRQEEERARREAAKRAAQEEAARKEAERRKRQEEERAREEEAARKKREREEKIKKEREAREREAKEKERREREEKERLSKEKAEKERIAREAREKAEKERQAKLEEERLEKQRREASQQRKVLAAQQASREKAAADKEKAEKAAAAERAKAAAATPIRPSPGVAANRKTSVPPPPGARNGPSPPGMSPAPIQVPGSSMVQSPSPTSGRTPLSSRLTPKAPQFGTFPQAQPVPSMPTRATQAPPPGFSFAPGSSYTRQSYRATSPVFSGPPTNGQMFGGPASLTGSPSSALPRSFGATPDSAFDAFVDPPRQALGVGYLGKPATPTRTPADEPFRAGAVGQRMASGPSALFSPSEDDFVPREPIAQPIGPPPPGPIGSRPPGLFEAPPAATAAAPGAGAPHGAIRSGRRSPTQPDKVLGSAALGGDEVVPDTRRAAPSWNKPMAGPIGGAAIGGGRWSVTPARNPSWGTGASNWPPAYGSSSMAGVTSGMGNLAVGGSTPFGAPGGPSMLGAPGEMRQTDLAPGAPPPGFGSMPPPQHQPLGHDQRRGPNSFGAAPGQPFYGQSMFSPGGQ